MINIQNQNSKGQGQIMQQTTINFQEKNFYNFLEPGEQKEYSSFRNSCCCTCGQDKNKREKCFIILSILSMFFNMVAIGTCLYISEDYRKLRKILKGMISYKNDIKNFWVIIQNNQFGIEISNYIFLAYYVTILCIDIKNKFIRIFFSFLFYIIFKVMFLLLFYLWIYIYVIINNQPMEFPKWSTEVEKSEEEKFYLTAIVYGGVNFMCLFFILIFNFCLLFNGKVLTSDLDLNPSDIKNKNTNYMMYNTNNINYITSSVAIMNTNQTNNTNYINENNSIAENENIKKT